MTLALRVTVQSYPRLPAAVGLFCALLLVPAGLAWRAAGDAERAGGGELEQAGLAELERRIAHDDADPALWYHYGRRLQDEGRHGHAAEAFRQVLEREPFHREAAYQRALALAEAGDAEILYAFLSDLVLSDAKLAASLFERPECGRYLAEERFRRLNQEAKVQALD